MKILLFILIPVLCFGQYTTNALRAIEWNFEGGLLTGWSGFGVTTTNLERDNDVDPTSTRIMCIKSNDGGNDRAHRLDQAVTNGAVYRMQWNYKGVSGGTQQIAITDAANPLLWIGQGHSTFTDGAWHDTSFTFTAVTATLDLYFYSSKAGGAVTDSLYVDNVIIREQLDSLYTDGSQADDTDDDSTKTLTEAFETRGSHSGGYFITIAGMYAESITMDSSFTKWEASGGKVYVTSVDFNSVTCSVDYNIYHNITTKLNRQNVRVYNKPKGFQDWHGFGGFNK